MDAKIIPGVGPQVTLDNGAIVHVDRDDNVWAARPDLFLGTSGIAYQASDEEYRAIVAAADAARNAHEDALNVVTASSKAMAKMMAYGEEA